jgi:putative ABC transport system permease protein
LDKNLPVAGLETMTERLAGSVGSRRFNMLLLLTFASLALVLAAVGIYGVMSHSVTQRTHEIGVRMALGAARDDVLKLVVRQGMALAFAGVLAGLGAAVALTRLMSSLLYGISSRDPVTFAVVSLVLMAVAFVASYLPARRATKVDPMVALRYE